MIEHQRADTAVDVTGRALVGGAEMKIRPHFARVGVVQHQRRRDRVAHADRRIAPRHAVSLSGESHAERAGQLVRAQSCCGGSIWAVTSATVSASASVLIVASINSRTDCVSGS